MSDNVENLMPEHLRSLHSEIQTLRIEMQTELKELKHRMSSNGGAFLTDTDLVKLISDNTNCSDDNKLIISPYDEGSLTPVGYDLRIGDSYATKGSSKPNKVSDDDPVILPPNSTSLISTLEDIRMPRNRRYSGLIQSKLSKVSKGLSYISTTFDPIGLVNC